MAKRTSRSRKSRLRLAAAIAAMAAGIALSVAGGAFAQVSTDQQDYSPGSLVTVNGGNDPSGNPGYASGETVNVDATNIDTGWSGSCSTTITAGDGSWSCAFNLSTDSSQAVGSYTYTATSTDASGNPIQESGTFTDAIQTATTVTSSQNPSTTGQSVTFTATVKSGNPSTNTVTQGQVKFGTGSNCGGNFTQLQAAQNVDSNGQVTYTTSTLLQGSTTIRACYLGSGSGSFALQTSDGTVAQTVNAPSDTTPPTPGTVNDGTGSDINFQNSTSQLSANWSGFSDNVGIDHYLYGASTHSDCSSLNVVASTNVGTSTSHTTSSLSLTNGTTYYNCVDAFDAAGNSTGWVASDGVTVDTTPPSVSSIGLDSVSDTGSSNSDGITKAATLTYEVTFSESVTGVTASDFSVTAGTATNCTPGNVTGSGSGYTVNLTGCTEGTVTLTFAANGATDTAGNTGPASAASASSVTIDRTAPTISDQGPTTSPNGAGWYNHDVANQFTATDSLSGLDSSCVTAFPSDGTDNIQSKTTSGEGTAINVSSDSCTDLAGNTATAIESAAFKIDKTAPTLNPTVSPNPVLLNGSATASANANDPLSGVASSSCGAVDTSSVGPQSVSCTATDNAGNTADGNANYSVIYATFGMCDGAAGHVILQPINADGTSVFKQGSTVPAKFRVCDANGNSVGTSGVVWSFRLIKKVTGTVVSTVDESVDSTTPDSLFRWDPTAQQWIFNMSTKSLAKNTTYSYEITLGDNSKIDFQFGLR